MNKNKNKVIYAVIILLIISLGVCISIDFTKGVSKNKKKNNVDILNIDCNDENCKKEVKPKKKDNSKTDKKDTTQINENANTNANNNTNNSSNNGEVTSSTNGSGNNTSTGQTGSSTNTTSEEKNDLVVSDSYQVWKQQTNIKIFNVDKIAPGDSGSYDFMVNNNANKNVKYNINFDEENEYNINLRYKLKRGDEYIAGSSSEWVKFTDLNVINKVLNDKSNDSYTIEWKWIDAENDTAIGRTPEAKYRFYVHISALETDEFDKNASSSASFNPFTGDNILYYVELAILFSIILLLLIIKDRQKDEYESSKTN